MWQLCFFFHYFRNFNDQLSSNFHRFVILCICWETPCEKTGLSQLPIVSTAFKRGARKSLKDDALSFGWTIEQWDVLWTRSSSARKRTHNTYHGRIEVNLRVSGSHSKHPCLQVPSGLQAAVIKFTYEASFVSYQKCTPITLLRMGPCIERNATRKLSSSTF